MRLAHRLAGLATAVTLTAPATASARDKTYALVIGNNEPPPGSDGRGLSPLHYADDDAVRYAELFEQFADDVRLVTVLDAQTRARYPELEVDAAPRLSAIRRQLSRLLDQVADDRAAGDEVTFYVVFSGHGAVRDDGQAVLGLLDASLNRRKLFDQILAPIDADTVHLILDACHAAGVVGVRGRRGFGKEVDARSRRVDDAEARSWVARRTHARFPHVGVLAATTAGEQAHEWSEIEAGIFSHEVLSALWGAADVNGDLAIEYTEVQAFVAAANRSLDDPRAAPQVVARPPATAPHRPLVDLAELRSASFVRGDTTRLGHFAIELDNGRRHLDANIGLDSATVAIPSSATAFVSAGDREARLGRQQGSYELDALSFESRASTPRGSTAAAYRRGLFAEPYTADYYRGYVDSIEGTPVRFEARPVRLTTRRPLTTASPPPPILPPPEPARPDELQITRRKRVLGAGVTFTVLAGAGLVSTVVAGSMALVAKMDRDLADLEMDPNAAYRHRRRSTAAITSAVLTAVCTAIAIPLMIRSQKPAK